ncbi:CEP135 family protein [Megaselia abdita]
MTEKGEFMHRNLRDKLDCLGYNQPFPVAAVPLVGSIFDDLIKTTESLRDSKLKISQLLEEKSCWELGVEPYKCDNSRLLSDCNQLHLELLNQRENYEKEISEIARRIRTLETEKHHLQDHCNNLEKALKTQASSAKNPPKRMAGGSNAKKPFTSAVKSGSSFPPLDTQLSINKCDCYVVCKDKPEGKSLAKHSKEIEKLQNDLKDLCDDLNLHKRRVESRDREISRLNDLMKGGRPPAALARDCCYKNYGALSEDVELLQQEKYENHSKIKSYEQKMHEAMQRAVHLAEQNKRLTEDLDELKEVALKVEKDANTELSQRDKQIEKLKADVEMLKSYLDKENKTPKTHDEKRKLNEKINELTQKESTLKLENDRMHKKIHKLKHKIDKEKSQEKEQGSIEEIMRLKTERDFFHQEYLRFMSKPPTDKAVEVLQLDIRLKEEEIQELKSRLQGSSRYENSSNDYENLKMELRMKDEEIRSLRIELQNNQIQTSRSQRSGTTNGECVQAVVLRLEREMNCLRADIENSDVEKRKLLAKLHYLNQSHLEEVQRYKEKVEDLQSQCNRLEKDCTEKSCNRIPGQTQIVLLKEENEELKNSSRNIEKENYQLKSSNEHLKLLLDQTEKALIDYQNRFALAETQLGTVESKLTTLDSNRDRSKADIAKLKTENTKLRAIVFELENEKDGFVPQISWKCYQIEFTK